MWGKAKGSGGRRRKTCVKECTLAQRRAAGGAAARRALTLTLTLSLTLTLTHPNPHRLE